MRNKITAEKIAEMISALEYCANHARPSIVQDVAKEALLKISKKKSHTAKS